MAKRTNNRLPFPTCLLRFVFFVNFVVPSLLRAQELPTIPVGGDAYTMWEQWPLQRIGASA